MFKNLPEKIIVKDVGGMYLVVILCKNEYGLTQDMAVPVYRFSAYYPTIQEALREEF